MILLDPYERGNALPPDAGMDTRLVLSLEQLTLGIFPALDPIESHARFEDSAIAEDVRRLLRASTDVRRFFHQPMIVAEEHTGEPPTWVARDDAETALQALVAARP